MNDNYEVALRRYYHAVSMDIEKMFHMVKVREVDLTALRYLWKLPGKSGPPKSGKCVMLPFGLIFVRRPFVFIYSKNSIRQ